MEALGLSSTNIVVCRSLMGDEESVFECVAKLTVPQILYKLLPQQEEENAWNLLCKAAFNKKLLNAGFSAQDSNLLEVCSFMFPTSPIPTKFRDVLSQIDINFFTNFALLIGGYDGAINLIRDKLVNFSVKEFKDDAVAQGQRQASPQRSGVSSSCQWA